MLLTMGLILAFMSCFIEVKLVSAVPALERAYINGFMGIPGPWINNIASLGLSFALGIVFGVEGLTMAFGGIISIPMSNMWFMGKKVANERGITMAGTKSSFAEHSRGAANWWDENSHYLVDFAKTIFILIKVITWPLRAALKANSIALEKKQEVSERIAEGRERITVWSSR